MSGQSTLMGVTAAPAVARLNGRLKEALRDALCSAFDKQGFVELLSLRFPRNLTEEVNLDTNERALGLQVVELCDSEGWTIRLVQAAREMKPDNPNLRAIAEMDQFREMPWSRGVEDARETLRILPRLMDDAVIRAAVIGYRKDFEAADEQLQLVAVFKEWHNCLHVLQVKLYDRIVREARSFPDDERACEALQQHWEDLHDLATPLAHYLALPNPALAGEVEWIQNLRRVVDQLHEALQGRNPALLNQTLLRLKRILAVQPSDVNRLLTTAAASVRLIGLVDAMQRIGDRLTDQHVEESTLAVFRNGRQGLEETRQKLEALVKDHNQWQKVDRDLQQIDQAVGRLIVQPDQTLLEIQLIWNDRKPTIDALCAGGDELKPLCQACDELDKALLAGAGRIAVLFSAFVRLARKRFFQVDGTLRTLSQDLLVFGQPVNAILGVIAND